MNRGRKFLYNFICVCLSVLLVSGSLAPTAVFAKGYSGNPFEFLSDSEETEQQQDTEYAETAQESSEAEPSQEMTESQQQISETEITSEDGDTEAGGTSEQTETETEVERETEIESTAETDRVSRQDIPGDTAVVNDTATLSAALRNAQIHYIYLEQDITITSTANLIINADREFLVISGKNPYAANGGDPEHIHTIQEYSGSDITQTIRLTQSGKAIRQIVIKDLVIKGKNHFGFVYIADGIQNVLLKYDNVDYTGPQITFYRDGVVHYKDSSILLINGSSAAGECAETGGVILEGRVTIAQGTATNANEIFWLERKDGNIDILENADVTVKSGGNATSGFVFGNTARTYNINVGAGASFRYEGTYIFWENNFPKEINIGENAEFSVRLNSIRDRPAIRTHKFYAGVGSMVMLESLQGGTLSLLDIGGPVRAGSVIVQKPRQFVLKSPGKRLLTSSSGSVLTDIAAGQLNYWNGTVTGSYGQMPQYSWRKADGSDLTVQANLDTGGLSQLIGTNYNHSSDASDFGSVSQGIDGTTIKSTNLMVIAIGELPLSAKYDETPEAILSGSTYSDAMVQAFDNTDPGNPVKIAADVSASGGEYRISVSENIRNKEIRINAYWGYLMTAATVTAIPPQYTVYFDTDGGTAVPEIQVLPYGVITKPAPDPVKDGFRFDGWYKDADGTVRWDFDADTVDRDGLILYAKWHAANVTLRYQRLSDGDEMAAEQNLHAEGSYLVEYPELSGYLPVHYQIDGHGREFAMTDPVHIAEAAAVTITVYYASTQISARVPTQMLFAAFESGQGEVISPEYEMENTSELPISVSLDQLKADSSQLDGIELTAQAEQEGELALQIQGSGGFAGINKGLIPNTVYGGTGKLGILSGKLKESADRNAGTGKLVLGGNYIFPADWSGYVRPRVDFVFLFELADRWHIEDS